mmetsp:Transcript_37305/g.62781  ORF Transcript_37305/g.62781 Transcript_37305/m.62781 type:complete len:278 (-) Transcript_37305:930-1763(-)
MTFSTSTVITAAAARSTVRSTTISTISAPADLSVVSPLHLGSGRLRLGGQQGVVVRGGGHPYRGAAQGAAQGDQFCGVVVEPHVEAQLASRVRARHHPDLAFGLEIREAYGTALVAGLAGFLDLLPLVGCAVAGEQDVHALLHARLLLRVRNALLLHAVPLHQSAHLLLLAALLILDGDLEGLLLFLLLGLQLPLLRVLRRLQLLGGPILRLRRHALLQRLRLFPFRLHQLRLRLFFLQHLLRHLILLAPLGLQLLDFPPLRLALLPHYLLLLLVSK